MSQRKAGKWLTWEQHLGTKRERGRTGREKPDQAGDLPEALPQGHSRANTDR